MIYRSSVAWDLLQTPSSIEKWKCSTLKSHSENLVKNPVHWALQPISRQKLKTIVNYYWPWRIVISKASGIYFMSVWNLLLIVFIPPPCKGYNNDILYYESCCKTKTDRKILFFPFTSWLLGGKKTFEIDAALGYIFCAVLA